MNDYHVIKIIDEYSIAINAGSNNGFSVGDEFDVIGRQSVEMIDPITKEDLGFIGEKKARMKIARIYPKFSICNNVIHKSPFAVNYTSITSRIDASIMNLYGPEEFNVDSEDISGDIELKDEPIKIGDSVIPVPKKLSAPKSE